MRKIYKTKIKNYPDGTKVYTVYKNSLSIDDTAKKENFIESISELKTDLTAEEKELEKQRNLWKVKTKIKDYCLSNDFDYFWTLTFGGEDRYDNTVCFKKLDLWLRKMRRKHGKFDYIFIPERHKDGAIHFHGVTGGFAGELVDSGVKHNKATVFNCVDWKHGFSTLTRIRSKKKCASYVTKYVTKDLDQSIVGKGKKKYWCSRGLRLPAVEYSGRNLGLGLEPDYENDTCLIYKIK